jgi:hypothetical protein
MIVSDHLQPYKTCYQQRKTNQYKNQQCHQALTKKMQFELGILEFSHELAFVASLTIQCVIL